MTVAAAFLSVLVACTAASCAVFVDALAASAHVLALCVLPVALSESAAPSGDPADVAQALALASDVLALVSLVLAAAALLVATVALSATDFSSAPMVLR